MSDDDFYASQREASEIKTRIVVKYFLFWARVMVRQVKQRDNQLGYFDLFSGPGIYDDGTKSTPIEIIEQAVKDNDLKDMLKMTFNDKNKEYVDRLRAAVDKIDGIEGLKFKPRVINLNVGDDLVREFERMGNIPTFSFVDPFGYKGVTLKLLKGLLSRWGCDLVLFFNYLRINPAIDNEAFEDHIEKLFGGEFKIERLRSLLIGRTPAEREALILEEFAAALNSHGFKHVLPFTFKRGDMKRTSHHLIFVTKNDMAYSVMKQIMAKEGSEINQGVSNFTYTKSLSRDETPLLYLLERPIKDLAEMLTIDFSGKTLTMREVYERHHIGKPFIEENYKAALLELEESGLIEVSPRADQRPRRKGKTTFGPRVVVKFPQAANVE